MRRTQGPTFGVREKVEPEHRESAEWYSGKAMQVMKKTEAAKKRDARNEWRASQWAYKVLIERGEGRAHASQQIVVEEDGLESDEGEGANDDRSFKTWQQGSRQMQAAGDLESALEETDGWTVDMTYAYELMEHLEQTIPKAKQASVQEDMIVVAQRRHAVIHSTLLRHVGAAE